MATTFSSVFADAVATLQRLAVEQWTDYNASDPGVTILEQVCYALSDVAYRLSYDMPDLLASGAGGSPPYASLPAAAAVLTCQPVTQHDLRLLTMDCPGVEGAWAQPAAASPAIAFHHAAQSLTFETTGARPLALAGLSSVFARKNPRSSLSGNRALPELRRRLHAQRPLATDFQEINWLENKKAGLAGEIEIAPLEEPATLLAQIFRAVQEYLAPVSRRLTLQQARAAGWSSQDIFNGPEMLRGFVEPGSLVLQPLPAELPLSGVIECISSVPGVRAVKSLVLTLAGQSTTADVWVLEIPPGCCPVLDVSQCQGLVLTSGPAQAPASTYSAAVSLYQRTVEGVDEGPLPRNERDIVPPPGEDRQVASYDPLQNQFPGVWGIGEGDLPQSAPGRRKALVRQLQACLTLFDQHMADDLSQLEGFSELVSFFSSPDETYFVQTLAQAPTLALPGAAINIASAQDLHSLEEDDDKALGRRNRFLNHLLGRFAESFGAYALMVSNRGDLAAAKARFLAGYRDIGGGRGTGASLLLPLWNTDNIGGYKLRLCALLGIHEARECTLAANFGDGKPGTAGFHIVEHLLLRPRTPGTGPFLSLRDAVTSFANSSFDPGKAIACASPAHGIATGAVVRISGTRMYDGDYHVGTVTRDTFDIPGAWQATGPLHGWWSYVGQPEDPFSNQVSLVFPGWITPFDDSGFRSFAERTVAEQTPAHITPYVLWLGPREMTAFEAAFKPWLQALPTTTGPTLAESLALMAQLGMGQPATPWSLDSRSSSFIRSNANYITIPGYQGITGSAPRTLELWMKSAGNSSMYLGLLGWGDTSAAATGWSLRLATSGVIQVEMNGGAAVAGATKVNDKAWHHVAVVLPAIAAPKGSDVLIYIDGNLEAASHGSSTSTIDTGTGHAVYIGNDLYAPTSSSGYFDGSLAEVRLWSTARTQDQIRAGMHTPPAGNEPSLEAWWKLDITGFPFDSSTHHRDGVFISPAMMRTHSLLPSPLLTPRVRFLFASARTFVEIPGFTGVDGASRTVEAWFCATRNGQKQPLLSYGTCATGRWWGLWLNDDASGNHIEGSPRMDVWDQNQAAATPLDDGCWHHLACTLDGGTVGDITVYVDGSPVPPGASSDAVGTLLAGDMLIGFDGQSGNYFNGQLAEVRLWSACRSLEQIRSAMFVPLKGDEAGLEGWWRLTDIGNAIALDSSVHKRHGALRASSSAVSSLPAGLVHYWPLSDGALPAADLAADGALAASSHPSASGISWQTNIRFAPFTDAARPLLRLQNACLTLPSPAVADLGAGFTFEAWIGGYDHHGNRFLFSQVDVSNNHASGFAIYIGGRQIHFIDFSAGTVWQSTVGAWEIGTENWVSIHTLPAATPPGMDSDWQHIAVAVNAQMVPAIFHNGISGGVTSKALGWTPTATVCGLGALPVSALTGNVTLGALQASSWSGFLAEVKIWNVTRSYSDVPTDLAPLELPPPST